MALRRLETNEIIHVSAIIEQVLFEQSLDDASNDARFISLVKQLSPEFLGSVVTTR
jgi:hypothetical protein